MSSGAASAFVAGREGGQFDAGSADNRLQIKMVAEGPR